MKKKATYVADWGKNIMAKYRVAFRGEFIKHKGYTIYTCNECNFDIYRGNTLVLDNDDDEWEVDFKEKLYKQAEKSIIELLGKKAKYTVEEAARYFQKKYMAQRIPYEYAWWYQDPSYEKEYIPWMPTVDLARIEPFDYNTESSQEKNITLVVDTINNPIIRERYPKIQEYEKRFKKYFESDVENYILLTQEGFNDIDKNLREKILQTRKLQEEKMQRRLQYDEAGHNNAIIVIGYIEEHIINSMYIECVGHAFTALDDDLHYEFWYFYNHS